jgi:hypothetical protein
VLLLGDSHAGVLADAFVPAVNALGFDAQVAVFGGCPYNLRAVYPKESCRTFNEQGVAYLEEHRSEYTAIVTSSSTLSYVQEDWLADGKRQENANAVDLAASRWAKDLAHTITEVGIPTLVVGDVPRFTDFPDCLRPSAVEESRPGCGVAEANSELEMLRKVISHEQQVALTASDVRYFDLGQLFCAGGGTCKALAPDGSLLMQDAGHLSVHGAKGVRVPLGREIAGLLGVSPES